MSVSSVLDNEALREERPDRARDREDGGDGDEEVGEETFAGRDLGAEEAEVESEWEASAMSA